MVSCAADSEVYFTCCLRSPGTRRRHQQWRERPGALLLV